MDWIFIALAIGTAAAAAAAMSLRNLIHCALAAVVAFGGLAVLFLRLDAQFVGLAQALVYFGAVAILIVFAILLTGAGGQPPRDEGRGGAAAIGGGIGLLAFATLTYCALSSGIGATPLPAARAVSVKQLGERLMTEHVLAMEAVGLLLTVALIGGVVLASREERSK